MEGDSFLAWSVIPLAIGREFGVGDRAHTIPMVHLLFCGPGGFRWIDANKIMSEPVQLLEDPHSERPVSRDEYEVLVRAVATDRSVAQ